MPILALIVNLVFLIWIILGKLPFSQKVLVVTIPVIIIAIALVEIINAYS
jgi:hypothetical protein